MGRIIRVLAAAALTAGTVAAGSSSAEAIIIPPPVPIGSCSARALVPGTAVTFAACDKAGTEASWAEWIEVVNNGGAEPLQAQVRVRVNGQDRISSPVSLDVPAQTSGRWDPVTGRRVLLPPYQACAPGSTVQPSVRLRQKASGVWSTWATAPAVVCPG